MKRILIILFISLLTSIGYSQDIKSILRTYNTFNPNDSLSLFFRIENINFFKNNEYKSDITDGYTLIGGFIKPQLVYYLNSKIRLSIGANLLKYSGKDKFSKSTLLLAAIFKPNEKETWILGNLNNDNNHDLPEFLSISEKFYTGDFETGFQYLFKGERLKVDCWIDWENFIEKNDPDQEKFTFGYSMNYTFSKNNSLNIFSIPLYVLINHKGGEIDTSDDPVSTISNLAIGLNYKRVINARTLKYLNFNILFTAFGDHTKEKISIIDDGGGIYTTISAETKIGDFMIGYWYSKNYFSSYGLDIFHSVSRFDTQYYTKRRNLLNLKYTCRYNIGKNATIGGSIENYFDFTNYKNNISASVFLVLNSNIFIKKLKK